MLTALFGKEYVIQCDLYCVSLYFKSFTKGVNMSSKEKFVYTNGKLTGKITTKTCSNGSKEIIRQKAHSDFLGGRHATSITSKTRITK